MNKAKITERLVEQGQKLFEAKKGLVKFTELPKANRLLNDLQNYPHAFVLASIMDRQIRAELAWLIPFRVSERLGGFYFSDLASLSVGKIRKLMQRPKPLHRFPEEMSNNFYQAIQRIKDCYGGDASRIWAGRPSSAAVVYRFLQFRGVGPKIATMATNILARDFKIPLGDYYSIDISADVHVRRVFYRLGLTAKDVTGEELIYKARAIHPEFQGLMDLPAWEIGRNWCKPNKPKCDECYMNKLCPSSASS